MRREHPAPQKSGYATLINDFDGKTAMVPVWWYMIHSRQRRNARDDRRYSLVVITCVSYASTCSTRR